MGAGQRGSFVESCEVAGMKKELQDSWGLCYLCPGKLPSVRWGNPDFSLEARLFGFAYFNGFMFQPEPSAAGWWQERDRENNPCIRLRTAARRDTACVLVQWWQLHVLV